MTHVLVLPRWFQIVFCAQMTLLASAFSVTLEEALDAPALSWAGTPEWEGIATAAARDGVDVAQAVSGPDSLRLETTVNGSGYLTFWWQITNGDDEGSIVVEVDGI